MRGCSLVVVMLAACYRPSPPAGAPCSTTGECPSGLTCVNGLCGGDAVADAPLVDVSDASPGFDAPTDSTMTPDVPTAIDAAPCVSFSTQFDTCQLAFTVDYTLSTSATFNTDTGLINGAGPVIGRAIAAQSGPVWVVPFKSYTLAAGAILRVVGSRPFAIASSGAMSIQGSIDATGGAGTRSTCSATNGVNNTGGGSGGGGGGFHGAGGMGSPGDSNTGPVPGGMGGGVMQLPLGPLGGCAGGAGGAGLGGLGGSAGMGGGAIYLVTSTQLDMFGTINAGGLGGGGGRIDRGGGGGGGSGGMILLEAPMMTIAGVLAANGGGGGGGADLSANGGSGGVGLASMMAATGGAGTTNGGPGAVGSAGSVLAGGTRPIAPVDGGGGGGGGAGFIKLVGTATLAGPISPPPS